VGAQHPAGGRAPLLDHLPQPARRVITQTGDIRGGSREPIQRLIIVLTSICKIFIGDCLSIK
jgi:hypothetical protein